MKKIKIISSLFLIFNSTLFFSQNEFSKWYFGQHAGLDFSTSPPTILTNGGISTSAGCATMCDNTGNLLFYGDGTGILNSTHSIMANGGGLLGNSNSSQGIIAVKQPGNNSIFYLFVINQNGGNNNMYSYSTIDMSLAAGLGSVTVKNATLYVPSCEKQVAVRHCNGKDVWIVSHEYNTNNFRSYLLTNSGLNLTPVITSIGETPGMGNGSGIASTAGQMKISPDGKKLALAVYGASAPSTLGLGGFQLFDFDASSGVVSNSLILLNAPNAIGRPYGIEFSPDGTKLYGVGQATFGLPTTLYQWDICTQNTTAIIASQYSLNLGTVILTGALQRAINNKIYMAVVGTQNLHVINNPNASGVAMGFTLYGQSLAPTSTSYSGLPNYINPYTKPTPAPLSNSIACQKVSFAVPPVASFSSGCSSTPYPPSSYLWDFGETASGTANTSTLTNPVHTYSTLGTYTVQLILFNNCTNDTLKKVINITNMSPIPALAGPNILCLGIPATYTASGGTSYQWSNSTSTLATQVIAPSAYGTYSITLTAISNGCSLSKTFTIITTSCGGIEAYENNGLWHVFPNPFKEVLSVEASQLPASPGAAVTSKGIRIVNVLGEELISLPFENKIDLDMTTFSKGIYLVQLLDKNNVLLSKKVIKE